MCEEDRQLIQRMQHGEQDAFHQFARAWYPRIVRWVAARTDRDHVSDYAQEIWIRLTEDGCRRLLAWNGYYAEGVVDPNSLAAYLKQITVRRVVDLYRADNKQWLDFGDTPDIRSDETPLDRLEGEQIKSIFRVCFSQLPRLDKRMLIMKWNGRGDQAIGQLFRKTANAVRQRRHQMILRLRECLSDKLPAYFSHD